jgi:hypothetical protein
VLRKAGVPLWTTEAALAVLLLVVLLSAVDLPLVDLPQHSLQIANWLRIDQGQAGARDLELNFRTPYLLAYPIVRVLCAVLPVLTSLKLVLWLSVTLQALALRKLCERLGHDPWLGLLGYPLGLGYSFCFGFVAFCAALPLVYWAFAQLVAQREAPSVRRGSWLALTLGLLLVAHGVALAFFVAVAGPLLLWGGGKLWQRVWPLLSPPLLAAVWLAPGRPSTRLGGDVWVLEPQRWLDLPGQLVGIGAADAIATAFGVLLLGLLASSLGSRRPLLYWMPLLASLIGYGLFPTMFRGAGPLHPRFSSYLVPALLLAFGPRVGAGTAARRGLSLLLSSSVVLLFGWRLRDFNRETAGFHALMARLPAGLAIRPLVFDRGSRAFPGIPAHLHVPAYYSAEKGGSAGYSFAMYSISVVRFRPGVRILMGGGSEWSPESFNWERETSDYDYFIVKSASDRTSWLFPGPQPAAVLEQHFGDWWGYRRLP